MLTTQRKMHIAELEKSIIALTKRKVQLKKELKDIDDTIMFLKKQHDDLGYV